MTCVMLRPIVDPYLTLLPFSLRFLSYNPRLLQFAVFAVFAIAISNLIAIVETGIPHVIYGTRVKRSDMACPLWMGLLILAVCGYFPSPSFAGFILVFYFSSLCVGISRRCHVHMIVAYFVI